ncbi:hypothetical protein LXL04_039544 [Taraxacum kok-saghyz]
MAAPAFCGDALHDDDELDDLSPRRPQLVTYLTDLIADSFMASRASESEERPEVEYLRSPPLSLPGGDSTSGTHRHYSSVAARRRFHLRHTQILCEAVQEESQTQRYIDRSLILCYVFEFDYLLTVVSKTTNLYIVDTRFFFSILIEVSDVFPVVYTVDEQQSARDCKNVAEAVQELAKESVIFLHMVENGEEVDMPLLLRFSEVVNGDVKLTLFKNKLGPCCGTILLGIFIHRGDED